MSRAVGTVRYPFSSLEPLLAAHFGCPRIGTTHDSAADIGGWSDTDVAHLFGIDRRNVARWKSGGLSLPLADKAAVALGHMPWEIWPEWWADSIVWADDAVASMQRNRHSKRVAA